MNKLFLICFVFLTLMCCKKKQAFKNLDEENVILDEWTKFSFNDEFGDPYSFGFDYKTKELNRDYVIHLDLTSIGVLTTIENTNGKVLHLDSTSDFTTVSEFVKFKIKKEDNSIIELKSSRISKEYNNPYKIVNLSDSDFFKLLTNGSGELLKISIESENTLQIVSFKVRTIEAEFKIEE